MCVSCSSELYYVRIYVDVRFVFGKSLYLLIVPWIVCCLSHRELLDMTCQLGNALKSHSVKKGDRVAIYMPMSPLAIAAMLACTRIGAIHR